MKTSAVASQLRRVQAYRLIDVLIVTGITALAVIQIVAAASRFA